ncbi:acVLRF1 family peptidyl-tRNA hydrolase [Ornithinimicrobium panacihumi]|uniref:acVLRF1 family peptidyl-tRNA hydrolase n=1 Tax=Ornithinimicrobium panacihumi TaxID=2008449 RepID=UPI003F88D679
MSPTRPVEVAPARLPGWVERFSASHGEVIWRADRVAGGQQSVSPVGEEGAYAGECWVGTAADGSWARLEGWGSTVGEFDPAGGWVAPPGPLLVVLVRRGGYAVAVTSPSGELISHKVGTRHVQSRTAAGGWSQQRFARRRANQADALVEAVVGHAARVLEAGESAVGEVGALVLGGDRTLAHEVAEELARGPLQRLHRIPRRELWDLADPRRTVLDDAIRRALAVRVLVHNAGGRGPAG